MVRRAAVIALQLAATATSITFPLRLSPSAVSGLLARRSDQPLEFAQAAKTVAIVLQNVIKYFAPG